jgi:hypothetical protein
MLSDEFRPAFPLVLAITVFQPCCNDSSIANVYAPSSRSKPIGQHTQLTVSTGAKSRPRRRRHGAEPAKQW